MPGLSLTDPVTSGLLGGISVGGKPEELSGVGGIGGNSEDGGLNGCPVIGVLAAGGSGIGESVEGAETVGWNGGLKFPGTNG